jgi:hypothetical protein
MDPDMRFACEDGGGNWIFWSGAVAEDMATFTKEAYPNGEGLACRYGKRGDHLYVREALRWSEGLVYNADRVAVAKEKTPGDFTQTIRDFITGQFMPRWASRITLEITDIRVQRVQEISEADAIAEGVRQLRDGSGTYAGREGPGNLVTPWPTAKEAFADLWDTINLKRGFGWKQNVWCWAITFKKL